MSGFAYKLKYTTVMTPVVMATDDEAAGKVGKIFGVIAAIAIPFAAPAIWGAIAGSTAIGAGLTSIATGVGLSSGMAAVLGSATVGAVLNAGIAYASGARGGDVWRAAGIGALGGGLGQASGLSHVFGGGAGSAAGAAKPGLTALAKTSTDVVGNTINAANQIVSTTGQVGAGAGAMGGATGISGTIMNGIRTFFPNATGQDMLRIGAALVNAAVNNQSMGQLDGLVAQQRAELEALQQQDQAAYVQRINAAQQVLAAADKMDPAWLARVRMADVAGIEANQFRQSMRNIATKQGGSLDTGQRKAYERSAGLHAGRSKALAYNQGWGEGVEKQASLYGNAAGLFTGPNSDYARMKAELALGQFRAHQQSDRNSWGNLFGAFGETNYRQPASPDPSEDNQDPFTGGLSNPFGGGQ